MEARSERRGQSEIGIITHDTEDEADPWHGEPDEGDCPGL
jgi:hypothetical protein